MQPDLHRYVDAAWLAVLIVWIAGAFTTKQTVRAQPRRARVLYASVFLVGCLLFTKRFRWGFLMWRFVPTSPAAAYLGLILAVAGVAFTIWARLYLGSNWSGRPTIKKDHTLVRSGPYAVVRHPIYTGIVVAMLGTAIVIGEMRGLIATAMTLLAFKLKSRLEEAFMTEQFGQQYVQYRQRVKGLIPLLW